MPHSPRLNHLLCRFICKLVVVLGTVIVSTAEVPAPLEGFDRKTFTELNPNFWHSGDTFSLRVHIKNGTRSQHFRLYGVNTPELDDTREGELLQDIARFRLPREDILKWGEQASATVRRILANGGTIHTKRDPAPNLLDRRYHYSYVHDSQGRDVAQLLIEAGLATYDPQTPTPPPYSQQLLRSQEAAMRAQRGIWSQSRDAIPALPVPDNSTSNHFSSASSKKDALPNIPGQSWLIYTDGVFAPDYYTADGDSFAIKSRHPTSNRPVTQVWRLYGVDCPESDMQIPERVREQAKYFGVEPVTVTTWGKKASRFTAKFLTSGPVTIHTFHETARGVTSKTRFYGIVHVNQQDLALTLIKEGLARAGSMPLPGRSAEARGYRQLLFKAENDARKAKQGIWQYSRTP